MAAFSGRSRPPNTTPASGPLPLWQLTPALPTTDELRGKSFSEAGDAGTEDGERPHAWIAVVRLPRPRFEQRGWSTPVDMLPAPAQVGARHQAWVDEEEA